MRIKYLSHPSALTSPIINPSCSELEVNKWLLSDFVLRDLIPVVGTQPFPLDELMLMSSAVTSFEPRYIFEWGTHIGKSALIFYKIVKAFNINCLIHSIDLPADINHVEHPGEERGKLVKGIKEVNLHRGDGVTKAIEIYKSLANSSSTLFFVDGDHEYKSVKRELEIILQHVPNPVVLLHDTFYQSEESNYNIGPWRAINDVISSRGDTFKMISCETGLPGMTLIFRK